MTPARLAAFWLLIGTGLSLSVGWGIRGNFGHEYGAMIPGALATMAAVLLSGRSDWWPRIAYFGFFGALGWSLGGSISYMQVIGYTHSGHSLSVLYGFVCLFITGFLWAALGGAGAGLAACLEREKLVEFLVPLTTVFAVWWVQDFCVGYLEQPDAQFRQASPLYWYDTDWLAALTAGLAVLLLAAIRRRFDAASGLILSMAAGWWIGFLLLVVVLGWRMTPPRGDNWAGCVGMTAGLWWYLQRRGWREVTISSLITGLIGGFGFATATMLKLVEVRSGWETNWHSILEQTYGLINGLGLGVAFLVLAQRVKPFTDERWRGWTAIYPVAFVLLVITYVNLRKNPGQWVKAKAWPNELYGLAADVWFDLGYIALTAGLLALLLLHQRRRLPFVPESGLGCGQLLYLAFLWWMVIGNFERALPSFAPQRLVTEGVIHLNAVLCTVLIAAGAPSVVAGRAGWAASSTNLLRRVAVFGALAFILSTAGNWAIVRGLYGNEFAGHAGKHIRFGPEATAKKEKPSANQPHP